MPTLLLSARQTDDAQKLWRACIAANWDVVRVHGWKVPSVSAQEVAIYGEPLFASLVAQTLNLHLVEPPLDWLPRLPQQRRGREVRLTTLADARTLRERAFIKPADAKCFEARVYESGNELPAPGPLPEDLPVLVQGIVNWTVEYRCFVVDRAVATASAYWRDGALAKAEDGTWIEREPELRAAIQFCQQFMADPMVSMPDAAVVDVGIIENCGWAVVECNAAWASGTYGCDPLEVLRVLRRACGQKSA
jgi:hypothetical protein